MSQTKHSGTIAIHEREREVAAYLYYKGFTESTIAQIMGYATTTINNRLKEAKEMGLIVEERSFDRSRMADPHRFADLQLFDYTVLLGNALRKCNARFYELTVLDSGGAGRSDSSIKARLHQFGHNVAPLIKRLLQRSTTVGVSWGATLAAVVPALQSAPSEFGLKRRPMQFVPTCGEPLEVPQRENSSSFLAGELDRCINGTLENSVSLSGIPAVIPSHFHNDQQHDSVIRRFFEDATAYGSIFGKQSATGDERERGRPLIDKIDTILTSSGPVGKPWRMCGRELCETGGVPKDRFTDWVLGDIAGVLIPKSETIAADPAFQLIEKLWTGIKRQHLESVAKQATRNGSPGVVVIAIGSNKAVPLLAGIQQGLVNALYCDEDLARVLAERCGVKVTDEAIRAFLKRFAP